MFITMLKFVFIKGKAMQIAIDVGYGDVKVATKQGLFKFHNAIAFSGAASVDYGQNALEVFTFNDIEYVVGDQALLNSPFITRDYGYLYEYVPLLIYKALKMANVSLSEKIQLITGLSLKDWDKAEQFGERLTNIFVNNEYYKIEPENIKIVPQGKGIYIDYKSKNQIKENDYFAIVDIGYNTFDFLTFLNGKPVPNKNYANTLGVNTLIQEIQKILNRQYNVLFSEQECKNHLRQKSIRIGAKSYDITTIVHKEVQKYFKLIKNEIMAKNMELMNRVYGVVISGGGAYLLEEIKANIFDHQVYSCAPYEFANVRGYLEELLNE